LQVNGDSSHGLSQKEGKLTTLDKNQDKNIFEIRVSFIFLLSTTKERGQKYKIISYKS
jgi:hypothetical protein